MKLKLSELENKINKEQEINFSQIYEEFNKNVPTEAKLHAKIIGDYIKIEGTIKAALNAVCDKCLKEFTKELNINVDEVFIKGCLNDSYNEEFEIKTDCFIEDLNGRNEIDITDFVYQSVILNIPNKLVCDINCNGNENLNKYIKTDFSDPRLEIFRNIKIEKE